MSPKWRTGCLWSAGLIITLAIGFAAWLLGPMLLAMNRTHRLEKRMATAAVYEPVARTLALYAQSDPSLIPECMGPAWLPEPLTVLGSGRANVSSNAAQVEMGGGFYHFGYRLELDHRRSDPSTIYWTLHQYAEGRAAHRLCELGLPTTARLDRAELLQAVNARYARSISANPASGLTRQGQIMFLLRFHCLPEAAAACRQWSDAQPENWLPPFALAHIRARQGDLDAAAADLAAWVERHHNFATRIYLFLFHLREGRAEAALGAVRAALAEPFVEPPGTSGNKFYLGHNGARFAYQQGDYPLARALCEKMLADPQLDVWWRRRIWKLQAATAFMSGDITGATAALQEVTRHTEHGAWGTSPESLASDARLAAAIREQRTNDVRNIAHWLDPNDDWFDPFDTDETEVHGRQDVINPYPSSWKP